MAMAEERSPVTQGSSSEPKDDSSMAPKIPASPIEAIKAVAAKFAAQPLPSSDPDVWGVLTAISNNARKRKQGINILLTSDSHCIGRIVDDVRFQIDSAAVSQRHCEVSRKSVSMEDVESPSGFCKCTFLKDTSTNGTYLNWKILKRGSSKFEAKLCHGDIISLAATPQHEQAFAFVYREVQSSLPSEGAALKRKAEELVTDNKRPKGIGIGAPEGPISLDDFRSLQRSNTELRKQLESQVLKIEALQNEKREAVECHQNEMKELRESVSKSYKDQLDVLNDLLESTKKDLSEANKSSSEKKHTIEDLNERLSSALQSCTEANELVKSQTSSIAELKSQLDEERDQRRKEREKASADLKASIQRVQSEAEEELKQVSDAASKREKELQEVISKLQESERENLTLVESLRSKLEETRQKLVSSDYRIRQLEAQLSHEEQASTLKQRKVEDLEIKITNMWRELDKEKAAREEAWAKVSTLELEISSVMRELEFEKRRLRGARERIMLRETQLRAFYSTTEEIKLLFTKQQEQLKSMQRALEDEENYDDASLDDYINKTGENVDGIAASAMEATGHTAAKAGPSTSAKKFERGGGTETSSEEDCNTEKHDCGIRSQDDENTQEAEFPNDEVTVKGGFGSDIDGIGTCPVMEVDADGTEQVLETESPGVDTERKTPLNNTDSLAGDTMQLEDDTAVQETEPQIPFKCEGSLHHLESNHIEEAAKATDARGLITTEDLLASEIAGSWACSTAPSVYGDNESPHNDVRENHAGINDSNNQVGESQSTSSTALATKLHPDHEIRALSNMIGIMAPDVKEQFQNFASNNNSPEKKANVSDSDSETDEECVEASKDVDGGSESDDDTQADMNEDNEDDMNVDGDSTAEDSVG
ncbi:unnamed protein product [Amaranthus hypochondriacus]